MAIETVQPGTAVQRAVHAIREGIRSGRFVPGQRLIEPDLTRELGVGRNAFGKRWRSSAATVSSSLSRIVAPPSAASHEKMLRTSTRSEKRWRG